MLPVHDYCELSSYRVFEMVDLPLLTTNTLTSTTNRNTFAHAKLVKYDIHVKRGSYSISLAQNILSFAVLW